MRPDCLQLSPERVAGIRLSTSGAGVAGDWLRSRGGAMQAFPHHYRIAAAAAAADDVALSGDRLPRLYSAPPAEFDGPGDRWSPETLLLAAVADCFVLTFRAAAKFARFHWLSIACDAEGIVDRAAGVTAFTAFSLRVLLQVPAGTDEEQARRLLSRAKQNCLISNSLKAACDFHLEVQTEAVEAA
jgi:peroxiredoxin-like protein